MRCPCCGRGETGQVGNREYYCWNCCVEFHGAPGSWRLFAVDTEGTLVEVVTPEEPVDGVDALGQVPAPDEPAGAGLPALG